MWVWVCLVSVSAWCSHAADTNRLLVLCVWPMADAASPLGRAPSPEPAPPRLQKLVKIDNPRLAHAQFSQDMELLASATDDYRALYVWRSFHAVGGGALVVALVSHVGHDREHARTVASADLDVAAKHSRCSYLFVEPLPWMGTLVGRDSAAISCPQCQTQLGCYFASGCTCSCGDHVSGPCIRLAVSQLHMSDLGRALPRSSLSFGHSYRKAKSR